MIGIYFTLSALICKKWELIRAERSKMIFYSCCGRWYVAFGADVKFVAPKSGILISAAEIKRYQTPSGLSAYVSSKPIGGHWKKCQL